MKDNIGDAGALRGLYFAVGCWFEDVCLLYLSLADNALCQPKNEYLVESSVRLY